MNDPIRWGFLGAGYIASRALGPAVHAATGAALQSVAARDGTRARALEPVGRTYDDYAAVCTDPDVDVVYVALPGNDHLPWTLAALAAGKAVLCEKPLGCNVDEVQRMVAAATAAERPLVEAAWNRWHPRTQRLIELTRDHAPGDAPLEVAAAFTFGGVPEGNFRLDPHRGGGALYDVGCYAIAASQALLGPAEQALLLESAHATIGPSGVDLTTSATLLGTRGRATVTASIDAAEHQHLSVSSGAWGLEAPGQAFTSWREQSALRIRDGGRWWDETFAPVDAYQLMVEAVSRHVRGDRSAWVLPLAESAATALTIDEIKRHNEGAAA